MCVAVTALPELCMFCNARSQRFKLLLLHVLKIVCILLIPLIDSSFEYDSNGCHIIKIDENYVEGQILGSEGCRGYKISPHF